MRGEASAEMSRWARSLAALAALGAVISGCGGSEDSGPGADRVGQGAFRPQRAEFPAVAGRSLERVAAEATTGPQVGFATSVYVPGRNRLAFGLIDSRGNFLYGPTAVYFARTPQDVPQGPVLAPADSLVTERRFRSRGAATEKGGIAAIYAAQVALPSPGRYAVLVLTRVSGQLRGAATQITVSETSRIPAVGEPAPRVRTDTLASAGGQLKSIETRVPSDRLHDTDLRSALGRRPVALLFSTPALCESRVCGPVTDIATQLNAEFGDSVTFIHQEVFIDNDPKKGLREPLRRFGLRTEPWLFTIDQRGRVAARLEGSFGVNQFKRAVVAAMRR